MVFLSQKVEGSIFPDYWKVLVLIFLGMGNTGFSWAKKLMERWYLVNTGKALFWTFRWWQIRFFWVKKLMKGWYLHGFFELSMIFQDLGNMVFRAVCNIEIFGIFFYFTLTVTQGFLGTFFYSILTVMQVFLGTSFSYILTVMPCFLGTSVLVFCLFFWIFLVPCFLVLYFMLWILMVSTFFIYQLHLEILLILRFMIYNIWFLIFHSFLFDSVLWILFYLHISFLPPVFFAPFSMNIWHWQWSQLL